MAHLHRLAFAPERGWTARAFSDLLENRHTRPYFVPHGFALARTVAGESELLTIAVTPAHQGHGTGRDLLRQWIATAPADVAFLEVAADNAPALALYRRAGFTIIGRRVAYYARKDRAAVDAITMKRDLTHGNARQSTVPAPEIG